MTPGTWEQHPQYSTSFIAYLSSNMNDVANSRALSRSRLGLSRELQQQRTDLPPDPSIGGTRGYPVWFRMRVLATSAFPLMYS